MRLNTSPITRINGKTQLLSFNTGGLVNKIRNVVAFDAEMVNQLTQGNLRRRILRSGARGATEYYFKMLDAKARSDHKSFHHIYEWDKTGDPNARLFEYSLSDTDPVTINFNLLQSTEPNRDGYMFYNKAFVMEIGEPVTIYPKNVQKLKYQYKGNTVFTSKPSFVPNPGGDYVAGSFENETSNFMQYHFTKSLTTLGFFDKITKGMERKSRVIVPRVTKKNISGVLGDASRAAEDIVKSVERIDV